MNRRISKERPKPHKQTRKTSSRKTSESTNTLGPWLQHHRLSCIRSFQELIDSPWQTLMTCLVIAIALALPTGLYLALENIQGLSKQPQNHRQISVYLDIEAKPLAVQKLSEKLRELNILESVELTTPDQAKEEFEELSELGDLLTSLQDNPLPYILTLTPADDASTESLLTLEQELSNNTLIEQVQWDLQWLERLQQITLLIQRSITLISILLLIGLLLIIGNTIRLTIENRKEEIIVTKMVGGTDGFIRRPFLYTGLWFGLGGSLLAIILLTLSSLWVSPVAVELLSSYESSHTLYWITPSIIFMLVAVACFIGWVGSWIAVNLHLKDIEP